jgi:hypothetical protein
MSGVEARELVPRELDEPYGYEPGLAVLACLREAEHAARQANTVVRQVDWLVFEDEDEQAFLQLWLEELGKLEEEEKDEHE